jgi:uncharacterized protein (TIRG00374 family)
MRDLLRRIREKWLSILGGSIGIIVIGVVFFIVLPTVADPRDVWDAVKNLSWPWLIALAAVATLNVITYAPPYMAALPGLKFRPALAVTTSSTASTYIAPGGFAVGMGLSFAMLRAWGFRGSAVTIAVTVATIWNQFIIFGTPAIAITLLSWEGGRNPLLQTSAFIGLAIFAAILIGFGLAMTSAAQARRVGNFAARLVSRGLRVIRREPVSWSGQTFVEFRADAVGLLSARWHIITAASILGHGTVFITFIVTLRALNITAGEITIIESFAAWALIRVLGSIPITPGGFGVVELGLTGSLVAFGAPRAEVVAAVLVYRFLTVFPAVILGAFFGATWRRHHAVTEIERVHSDDTPPTPNA